MVGAYGKAIHHQCVIIGEKGATSYWSGMEGLRHKYFTFDNKTQTAGGVYVFYNQVFYN